MQLEPLQLLDIDPSSPLEGLVVVVLIILVLGSQEERGEKYPMDVVPVEIEGGSGHVVAIEVDDGYNQTFL